MLLLSPVSFAKDTVSNDSTVVNINTATVEDMQALKGVGQKKAQAIFDYRQEHGNFDKVDNLSNVKGIGDSIVEQNRNKIEL